MTSPCRHFLTGIFNDTSKKCPYCEVDSAKELLSEALYALEYGLDMTKPDDMSGCDCPMCVVSRKIRKLIGENQ